MIVTCPACSSRYKLDESKVTGRGAKITCPKCKHVFVVYPGGNTGPLPDVPKPAAEARDPQNLASPMASALTRGAPEDHEWDDEPTRIGMQKPPPEPKRTANPTLAIAVETPEFEVSSAEAAARSPTLDFKKVGVSTWKVKIKIGLIYDFSDIKTLRKYIQDGRVTQQDVISYDGKLWRALSDIVDLDVFFVQTWEELSRSRAKDPPAEHAAAAPKRPPPEEAPAKPAAAPGPTVSPFRDPFAQKTGPVKKAAPPATKKVAASGNRAAIYGALALLVALGFGAGWYFTMGPGAPKVATSSKVNTGPSTKQVQDDLKKQFEAKEPDPRLTPVPPTVEKPTNPLEDADGDGRPDGAVPVNRSGPPPGATPVRPTQTPSSTQRPITLAAPVTSSTSDMTAADVVAAGDSSAKSGDWRGAVSAYQTAVSMEPTASNLRKLGEAQYKAGDSDGAKQTLLQAVAKGQTYAYKTLGAIAQAQGDVPGANGYYTKYFAANPKDKEVELILQSMQGG